MPGYGTASNLGSANSATTENIAGSIPALMLDQIELQRLILLELQAQSFAFNEVNELPSPGDYRDVVATGDSAGIVP